MITRNVVRWLGSALAMLGLMLLTAGAISAQTSTGSIRGTITTSDGKVVASADIVAKNLSSGVERSTTSRSDGSYNLPGLIPAAYMLTVRHIGNGAQNRQVVVQIGAVSTQDFLLTQQAVDIGEIVVQAAAPETRTSELSTNITSAQIEKLPSASRNFLDLAALAPGVTVSEDRANGTTKNFTAGGQSANSVNIFIDGASLKNDLTAGGTAGQDNSRGNPFPRNAIQEYRVISQNFKAEYQKATSAIITATTKSGGNVWSGNAFTSYQDKGMVAADTFDVRNHVKKPDYSRYLVGLSAGGPIIKDKLHVFGSYEGNYQNRTNTVTFRNVPTGIPALDSVNLTGYNGSKLSPFRETLLFGKLSYAVSTKSSAELSFSNRHETDTRDFGNDQSLQSATNFRNKVSIGTLKYNFFSGAWLNEANVTYENFRRNPSPATPGLVARVYHYPGQDAHIGSDVSTQDFTQKRLGFRDDVTYSGFRWAGQHVLKVGANVDFVTYDVLKRNSENPEFSYAQYVDSTSYDARDAAGPGIYSFQYQTPYRLNYGTGVPGLNSKNNQVGIYAQDDWTPTPRLTLNLGLRWDYESNMINTKYVTPQSVVNGLAIFNDSLPTPLDLNRYISNGHNRSPLTGAFQPRLGFSYALDNQNKTTVFGGFGIYYDRSIYDFSVDEIQKLTHPTYTIRFAPPGQAPLPGQVAWSDTYLTTDTTVLNQLVGTSGLPEAFLIDNKTKLPKSKQFSLGIRRVLGDFVATVTYSGQRGTDQFTYNWANFGLDTTGHCCTSFNVGAYGFQNIIYSSNDGRTWYDGLSLQLDRPYRMSTRKFGWGAGFVYTYAKRSLAGVDAINDLQSSFPGGFPNARGITKHADFSGNDERHHVVANWIMDVPYVFGIQFSGLITLGSGARRDIGGCPARFNPSTPCQLGAFSPKKYDFIIPGAWAYRRVDIRLRKDFPQFAGTTLGVSANVYNLFNYRNYTDFALVAPNAPNYGQANSLLSDPRRVELGVEYNF